MFDDASFQMRAPVDKRGRKIKRSKVADDFQRYYRLKDEVRRHAPQPLPRLWALVRSMSKNMPYVRAARVYWMPMTCSTPC